MINRNDKIVCEFCCGTGSIDIPDGYGQWGEVECDDCGGTGYEGPYEPAVCHHVPDAYEDGVPFCIDCGVRL